MLDRQDTEQKRSGLNARIPEMFRLVIAVRRGSASGYAAGWARYDTLEAARAAAASLLREERVASVIIVRDDLERAFVEWCTR